MDFSKPAQKLKLNQTWGKKRQPNDRRKVSRRHLLGLLGGAAVAGGAAVYTLDRFNTFLPQSPVSKPQVAEEPVFPQAQVEVAPVKEKPPTPNSHLGIRNDILKLMPLILEFGAKNVRMDGGLSEASSDGGLKDQKNRDLLDEAKRLGLDVLYVFNPQQLLSRKEIRARLKAVLSRDQKITVELGNEPDDVNVPYWKDRNLETFAEFIKIATEEAVRIKPDAKLVVGALVKQEKIKDLVGYLEKKGVDTKKLTYAIHAYHSPDEIWTRIALVKVATKGAPVMITEAGVAVADTDVDSIQEDTLSKLVEMYNIGRSVTKEPIFIHELPYGQDPVTREHFGFASKENFKPRTNFFVLKDRIAESEKERLAAATAEVSS